MKIIGKIQGSSAQAIPLIVGHDTVYVHTDIMPVIVDNMGNEVENLYSYHEVQYDKDEYIKIMAEENEMLQNRSNDIEETLATLMYGGGI